ncbi:MAG: hypothetical protein RLZ33_356 [Bacteroidota bacterium]|jgi:hypothetical protein
MGYFFAFFIVFESYRLLKTPPIGYFTFYNQKMNENLYQLGYTLGKNHFKTPQFCQTNIKKKQVMATTVLTIEDLQDFKKELLQELKSLFPNSQSAQNKKWLKSKEVRKMLSISPGTLQNLRINGTIPYSKMGGVIYYDNDEILRILQKNTINNGLS